VYELLECCDLQTCFYEGLFDAVIRVSRAAWLESETKMRNLPKRIVLFAACSVLVFGAAAQTAFSAQTRAKTSKSETASAQKTGATVDLNTASEKELDSLPGVGPSTAKKIIAGRPYSSIDGLSKAGVSSATIKKIAPLVTVGGGRAATASESSKKPSRKTAKETQPEPTPATPSQPPPPPKTTSATTSRGTPGAGTVWVNLDTGIYHYSGSRYYGKTKNGKYMSEAEAMKAGYHAAKREKKPQ